MNLLEQFKLFLVTSDKRKSSNTIKNYLVDVKAFILWFESAFNKSFDPSSLNRQIVEAYTQDQEKSLSKRTIKRHKFSLKAFFEFLNQYNLLQSQDLLKRDNVSVSDSIATHWYLREYKDYLFECGLSNHTINNYINDIRKFKTWCNKTLSPPEKYTADQNILEILTPDVIEEYKYRLAHFLNQSPRSINRKLSSLRSYINFLNAKYFNNKIQINRSNVVNKEIPIDSFVFKNSPVYYSNFAPLRLVQRLINGYDLVEGSIASIISDLIKRSYIQKTQNKLLTNIPKEYYSPSSLAYTSYTLHKKILYHIRYTRPNWYKSYHNHSIVHYLHWSCLLVLTIIVAIQLHNHFFPRYNINQDVLGQATKAPRLLSFKGRLTDQFNQSITTASDIRFSLYDNPIASSSSLLWQEVQSPVTPSDNGLISVFLGTTTPISDQILDGGKPLYLGITIGQSNELSPRFKISSTSFAADSSALQGMLPITSTDSSANVILALDSSGSLFMGGSPTFQATTGEFKISGETLLLTTNAGSSGNLVISADGIGKIDLQKALVNTTDSGTIVPGGIEIQDRFGIVASSSAASAFIVNNDALGGDLFTASSSGLTRFVIDSSGNVGVGKSNPIYKLDIDGDLRLTGNTIFNAISYLWPATQSANFVLTTDGAGGLFWTNPASFSTSSGTLNLSVNSIQTNGNNSLTVGGSTTGDIFMNPQGGSNGKVQIGSGTISPLPDLLILDNATSDPTGTNGAMYYNTTLSKFRCFQDNLWKNCDGSGADVAEIYDSYDKTISSGEVVEADSTLKFGVKKNSTKYNDKVLGVVSTKPGVILEDDTIINNKVQIALVGRVPVKIAKSSSPINIGDYLTSSDETARAMKAQDGGYVIGKALESWTPENGQDSITVFIEPGWYYPNYDNLSSIPSDPLALTASNQTSERELNLEFLISSMTSQLSILNSQFSTITSPIQSPLASINEIRTNVISPLAQDSNIQLRFEDSQLSILNSSSSTTSSVISFDTSGNATFSGELSAYAINSQDASIAGRLTADTIIAKNIDGLDEKVSSLTNQYISNNINDIQSYVQNLNTDLEQNGQYINLASFSSQFGVIRDGLISLGPSTFKELSLIDSLSIGTTFTLSHNSVNVLGDDLYIQPLRQGGISFLSGIIRIDNNGNLSVGGEASFEKDIFVKGDVVASGSARFGKLNFNLVGEAKAVSENQAIASGSAGTAILRANTQELTIINLEVTEKSLIYITPTADTNGSIIFLSRKKDQESFTVGINKSIIQDIPFNWIIIN